MKRLVMAVTLALVIVGMMAGCATTVSQSDRNVPEGLFGDIPKPGTVINVIAITARETYGPYEHIVVWESYEARGTGASAVRTLIADGVTLHGLEGPGVYAIVDSPETTISFVP